LLTILSTSTTKDASLILAGQLIAANLNTANGPDPRPVCDAITQSNNLLSGFSAKLSYSVAPSSTTGQAMVGLARILDHYNNHLLTPGCTP
jgi:hypothetical protein